MGLAEKALFFFSSLGAFNGIILGVYFIFFTAKKHLSNIFLGALLLALSIRVGKSVAYFFDYNLPKTILQIGLTACFFIGPFLYYFVRSETRQIRKAPGSWMAWLTGWAVIIAITGLVLPYQRFPLIWGNYIIPLIYLQWGIYVALSVAAVRPLIRKMFRKESLKPYEKWVLTICGAILLIFIAYVWAFLGITPGSYITGPLYFSLILYIIVFTLLYRKKTNDLSSLSAQKYADKKLPDLEAEQIIAKLKTVMIEKELFKNPNLKVQDLAREVKISGHQLSQLLNDNMSKNFTLFVNEYRIQEACKILKEDSTLTIDAVGLDVGFNAKSTFFATFKKIKGMTPSAWLQESTPDL